jgi:formiminotetrahydrofolate cyclodeaminase
MVLGIAARKNPPEDDQARVEELIEAAQDASAHLARAADKDRAAYAEYHQALKLPQVTEEQSEARHRAVQSALRGAIETPLAAARSAVSAMGLCEAAAGMTQGDIAADVGGAAALLAGAVRAILLSVDANLRGMDDGPLAREIAAERRDLEERAVRQLAVVLKRVMELKK